LKKNLQLSGVLLFSMMELNLEFIFNGVSSLRIDIKLFPPARCEDNFSVNWAWQGLIILGKGNKIGIRFLL